MTADQVDLAFPVAREAERGLLLEDWRKFAGPRAAANANETRLPGILLAMRNDYIRGLAAYEAPADDNLPQALLVNRVVIMDRTREQRLSLELLGGLLDIAQKTGCERVRAELPPSSSWLLRRWSDPAGEVFRMPVECIARPATRASEKPRPDKAVLNFRSRT